MDSMISGLNISYSAELRRLAEKVLSGSYIIKTDALILTESPDLNLLDILSYADNIRQKFADNRIDLCAIVNAKSVQSLTQSLGRVPKTAPIVPNPQRIKPISRYSP